MSVNFRGLLANDSIRIGINLGALQNVGGASMSCWTDIRTLPDPAVHRASAFCEYSVGGALNDNSRFAFEFQNNAADPPGKCYATVTRRLDADGGSEDQSPPNTATAGRAFIVATVNYQTGEVKLYKDAVLINTTIATWTAGGNTQNTASAVAGIGSADDGLTEFTDGLLEDLRIYSRVLSPNEILTMFSCQGIDGIVLGLQSRFELQSGGFDQPVSAISPQDCAQRATGASVISGAPTYRGSIGPTFRRRLP